MQIQRLDSDDDAVSPVIGVILMVAITVILAAVIATFVLGLGDQVSSSSPQASFSFEYEGSSGATGEDLEITHNGGAPIDPANLYIRGDGYDDSWESLSGVSSDVKAGNSYTVTADASDTIRVVWESDDGQDSQTINTWNGPDA